MGTPTALLYQFVDPDPTTNHTLDDVQPVRPLPDGLLDPTRWDIPASTRLSNLTEDRTNAAAFELWAQELLGLAEFAQHCLPIDDLNDAVAHVHEVWWDDVKRVGDVGRPPIEAVRREALRPFIDSAMTLRQIAAATDLPLGDVVAAFFTPNARARAVAFADMEEEMIGGGLDHHSTNHFVKKYEVGRERVLYFAARHGIDPQAAWLKRRSTNPATVARRTRANSRVAA